MGAGAAGVAEEVGGDQNLGEAERGGAGGGGWWRGKGDGWVGARLGWGPEESEKVGEVQEALYLL